jgi:hypothetical protein
MVVGFRTSILKSISHAKFHRFALFTGSSHKTNLMCLSKTRLTFCVSNLWGRIQRRSVICCRVDRMILNHWFRSYISTLQSAYGNLNAVVNKGSWALFVQGSQQQRMCDFPTGANIFHHRLYPTLVYWAWLYFLFKVALGDYKEAFVAMNCLISLISNRQMIVIIVVSAIFMNFGML